MSEDEESNNEEHEKPKSESLLNSETFANFCRAYGIDTSSMNQMENNNKLFFKMLQASQSHNASTMPNSIFYGSWLSNLFSNINGNQSVSLENLNGSLGQSTESLLEIKSPCKEFLTDNMTFKLHI